MWAPPEKVTTMHPQLTVVNRYALKGGAAPFVAAISDLVVRVEAEGERGILSYRFFVNPHGTEARAVIDYATAAAWIGHHEIAMGWPEMRALHSVAELVETTFLGAVTPEIAEWMKGSGLTARLEDGFSAVAGFRRG